MNSGFDWSEQSLAEPVRRLVALVPPPLGGGTEVDWRDAERTYSHGFPDDFRQFMKIYGEGIFDDFISICGPVSEVYPQDASASVPGLTANARYAAEMQDYENAERLVGWGGSVDADLLCWVAGDADPNKWTTMILRRHWAPPESWQAFDCGMAELLCRYVRREIRGFNVEGLEYAGSRFVHSRDEKRYRGLGLDPWAEEPIREA